MEKYKFIYQMIEDKNGQYVKYSEAISVINKLKEQNREILKDLDTALSCGFYPDGEKINEPGKLYINHLIKKFEGN